MKRVTGIGGIFFKTEDPKKLKDWYGKHLGFQVTDWGCSFLWNEVDNPNPKAPARTEWSPFKSDTTYFQPSEKPFMFNYRVENLVELLKVLKEEGVTIVGEMQEYPYGKFGWILDPDGNKIELWEPIDGGF
ncbi:MAG: VOC family protein [Cyclobacteriaceae bacterium]|nr:VOC family protein [Cyclobacteriaceae bacterium]